MLEDRYIDVDGVRTRYKEIGSGRPIVLLHGGDFGRGPGSDTWPDEFYETLAAAGNRVIGFDRIGSGLSDDPLEDDQFRISAVMTHIGRFLDLLEVKGAVVIGQSRGGYIGPRLAFERPDMVARLVIINSASITPGIPAAKVPGTPRYQTYIEQMNGDQRHDAEMMSVTTDHITDEWIAKKTSIAESPQRANTASSFKRQQAAYYHEFDAQKSETVAWLASGEFTKPTLIIWGSGDATASLRNAMDTYEMLQYGVHDLRLIVVNRSGHWVYREYTAEVAAYILDFADREF